MPMTFRIALIALLALVPACKGKKAATNDNSNQAATATTNASAPKPGDIPAPPDVAAPPADAKKSPKGVSYIVLTPGKGEQSPTPNDVVVVNYTGWQTDGKMFDSSTRRKEPLRKRLGSLIPGWIDAVPLMSVGEKVRMWIPEELAYKGRPGAPPGMLVFEVELLQVEPGLPIPEDVKEPPADAKKTASGLAYKVLQASEDKKAKQPRAWDEVTAHYSGWTTDGVMFDSSYERKTPAKFDLARVIKGWQEGIPLMKTGDKFRFWIPEELAYKNSPNPDSPKGMLVFDVHVLDVTERPKPPPVPKDVAAPPADAQKTELGVFYKVLKKGKGSEKPTDSSTAEIHLTAWAADGTMFDNTYATGQPKTVPLNHVFPGLADAVKTMVVGQQSRFWIPKELTSKDPRAPQGMIVFDIELVSFKGNMGLAPGGLKPGLKPAVTPQPAPGDKATPGKDVKAPAETK